MKRRDCTTTNRRLIEFIVPAVLSAMTGPSLLGAPQSSPDISVQIFELMSHAPQITPGHRIVHAKGIVCQGTFTPSVGAAAISRAAHFGGSSVPVTVRLSDGSPDLAISDGSSDASPRGMAIRFMVGKGTDIIGISHNGFLVGTPEDFLAFVKAQSTTDPSKPHPWPIEEFLGSHPRALKFVQDPKPTPVSFATESFFNNNALVFVDKNGRKQTGRYQIVPVAGPQYLDDAAAKQQPPNFLGEELTARLVKGPVAFRLLVQLAGPSDSSSDSSVVWPDDRKKVELGIIAIKSLSPDNATAERELAFDPTRLTDGIELSDDPLPPLRTAVYAMAAAARRSQSKHSGGN